MFNRIALVALCFFIASAAYAVGPAPRGLSCEYHQNPLGIDTPQPRLSWIMQGEQRGQRQVAYRVLVASTSELLAADQGDLWDSGRIESDRSLHVEYAGKPLPSGALCHWKVRVWDKDNQPSEFSAPACWSVGLLRPADWKAKWIGPATRPSAQLKEGAAPLLRKTFNVAKPVKRATAYVCGLGFFELRLNGQKVGDHEMDPGFTRYDRRVQYVTHDLTPLLNQRGPNAIGLILGNAWYNYSVRAAWDFDTAAWRARPRAIAQVEIEYADGSHQTIASDASWKIGGGPIVYNEMLTGEHYDARLEVPGWDTAAFDDKAWQKATVVDAPAGATLSAMTAEPVRVCEVLKPVKVTQPKPGVFVFDAGVCVAGAAELSVSGLAGTTVELKFGEVLGADGLLDMRDIAEHTYQGDFQTDRYILKGEGREVWRPRFTYHGFQYVQVSGYPGTPTPEDLKILVMHASFKPAGAFECSNELLNKIQRATLRSYVGNFMSIPTDCPQREKNGWTGDAHLACDAGLFNFHAAASYAKWVQDLQDEQQPSGEVPGIVPTSGWGYKWGNGPAWDIAYLLVPQRMLELCGDERVLRRHFENHKRYVDYLTSKAKDDIVSIGLGDWVPAKSVTPVPITSTAYYYVAASTVARTAELLGERPDAERYAALADRIRASFNKTFYDPKTGRYGPGTQTAQSTAIYNGLVEPAELPKVLAVLVADVESKDNHLDTGILGAKYLLHALADNGRADVAYKVATQRTPPSWGYWIERGSTTLWETWDDLPPTHLSRNHIMFGDISAWCYETLAGLRRDGQHPGFKHFVVQPTPVGDLTWAKASHESPYGPIHVNWTKKDGPLQLDITVPANTTATVFLPTANARAVTESGKPALESPGVKVAPSGGFEVESGNYHFVAP